MRLQKLLAEAGLGSRRTVEDWIRAGRLSVNGRKAQLGDRATATDDVRLDGKRLRLEAGEAGPRELLLYYKPVGEVTTRSDPQGRPTVFERLPPPRRGRWINVGRLDVNTTGLLLLTTDGRLAHRLMHPSSEVEREYLVRVRGRPSQEVLAQLLLGVKLEDGAASFERITADTWEEPGGRGSTGSHSTFRVVLTEGRNREVRRLWEAVGFEVSRLKRVRYGPIELPRDLKPGGTRVAGPASLEKLAEAVAKPLDRGSKAKV
ncbi:MAG TPA: pseudouridine synthase [Steroidobacteraceae bacterium]|nr:pseudouridine synthase [Steroidobacteraceae bacterium]